MAFGWEHNGRTSRPLFDASSTIDPALAVDDASNFRSGGHRKVTIGGTF
jgi:hypothetical protein